MACQLTIRSSRARFAASCKCYTFSPAQGRKAVRLNSGVRCREMPWWLYPYLVGYAVFMFLWVRDDIRENGAKPLLIAELLSDGCMVLVALGYWLPSVRALI